MTTVNVSPDHAVVTGDCLGFLRNMRSQTVTAVVTSPPYNIGVDYGAGAAGDLRPQEEYLEWLSSIFREILRVLTPEGHFFLNVAGTSTRPLLPYEVLQTAVAAGFVLQNNIAWIKSVDDRGHFKPVKSSRYLHRAWEHIFHLTATGSVVVDRLAVGIPYGDKSNIARRGHAVDRRCRGNTWFIPYDTRQRRHAHPAAFPRELVRRCLGLAGPTGAVVDPFAGSGTTAVVAAECGWKSVSVELNPEFAAAAVDALSEILKTKEAA